MEEKISKYAFKNESRIQFELVDLESTIDKYRLILTKPHRTEFYHIFLLKDCAPIHMIDFQSIQTQTNSLLFIDKDRVHQFDHSLNYKGYLFVFTDTFFGLNESDSHFLRTTPLFNDLTHLPYIPLTTNSILPFSDICLSIAKEVLLTDDDAQHLIIKNLLQIFLLLAQRERSILEPSERSKGPDLHSTLLFKECLEQNYLQTKSVSAYANLLNISVKKLALATIKTIGKSPKEIINDRVLLEAKRLLAHSTLSAKEIGYYLGFDEPTNFIKYFRKHTLKTPLKFREAFLY